MTALAIPQTRALAIEAGARHVYLLGLLGCALLRPMVAIDAHAYWSVNLAAPYLGAAVGAHDAFLYPPPAAVAAGLLGLIPWGVFLPAWTILEGVCLYVLVGPWALVLVALLPFWFELYVGNIHLVLAVALVASLRWPEAWAFPLLTKPTLGVGLLWYVARGEWRQLARALAVTAVIAGVVVVGRPDLWASWLALATSSIGSGGWLGVPILARLPVAAAVVVIGARRGWAWALPVGASLALPVIWITSLTVACAGGVGAMRWARAR